MGEGEGRPATVSSGLLPPPPRRGPWEPGAAGLRKCGAGPRAGRVKPAPSPRARGRADRNPKTQRVQVKRGESQPCVTIEIQKENERQNENKDE